MRTVVAAPLHIQDVKLDLSIKTLFSLLGRIRLSYTPLCIGYSPSNQSEDDIIPAVMVLVMREEERPHVGVVT